MPSFRNIAAYKFVTLPELKPLRERLLQSCKQWQLKGTILLSLEGINLFVAGAPESIEQLLGLLRSLPGLEHLEVKVSESEAQPFHRMLVRIKKEIIAFGIEGINPALRTSPKLSAKTLKQWLDEGRPVTLLDTRNDYEVKLGTFKNALPAGINHFREFPEAVRKLPEAMKEETVVMFCTGGIRCEKAGPLMEREGFKHIFQLEGGILKYFEECGASHYQGECFVFDQRVGVDPSLNETESCQCFACQTPLTLEEQQDPRYIESESCPHCYGRAEQLADANLARRNAALQRLLTPLPGSVPYESFQPVHVPKSCEGLTLLEFLDQILGHHPAQKWKTLCESGHMFDAKMHPVNAFQRVRAGEHYLYKIPGTIEPDVNPNIRILHEDEAIIVVDKPASLPMHPGGRFNRNTLQYFIHHLYQPQKPGHTHRLDANTSGVVLLTRTRRVAALLKPQFTAQEVEKIYLARVSGTPSNGAFSCNAPISELAGPAGIRELNPEGRAACTQFRVIERNPDGTTLVEAIPMTGPTNQIRLHLKSLNLPICGDHVYGESDQQPIHPVLGVDETPLNLHSWRIRFNHPLTGKRVEFSATPPPWAGAKFSPFARDTAKPMP